MGNFLWYLTTQKDSILYSNVNLSFYLNIVADFMLCTFLKHILNNLLSFRFNVSQLLTSSITIQQKQKYN